MPLPPTYGGVAIEKTAPRVYTKSTWAGTWTFRPHLHCYRAKLTSSPEIGSAELAFHFNLNMGNLRPGDTVLTRVAPLDINGQYVRVDTSNSAGTQTVWVGKAVEDELIYTRKDKQVGLQTIRCVGLEWLFARKPIRESIIDHGGSAVTVDWAPTFNQAPVNGPNPPSKTKKVIGNKKPGQLQFTSDFGTAELWNGKTAIDYLLGQFAPSGITWGLTGQTAALEELEDFIWPQDGLSVKAVLDTIISHQNGLGYYFSLVGSGTVNIVVFSYAKNAITVGGKTLPANNLQTTWTLPSGPPWTHAFRSFRTLYDDSLNYDKIIVRGNRLVIAGTWSKIDGTIGRGWTADEQTEYVDADASDNPVQEDSWRAQQQHLSNVYSNLIVPSGYNGEMIGDGRLKSDAGKVDKHLMWTRDDNGSVAPPAMAGTYTRLGKRFLRWLPMRKNCNYSLPPNPDGSPQCKGPADREPELLEPYGFIYDPWKEFHTSTPIPLKNIQSIHEWMKEPNIQSNARDFGLLVRANPKHHYGWNAPQAPRTANLNGEVHVEHPNRLLDWEESQHGGEMSWENMVFVAAFETDLRPRIILNNASPSENVTELIIDVDADFWAMSEKTLLHVENGNFVYPDGAFTSTLLKDEKDKLEAVAAFVKDWFSRRRQAFNVTFEGVAFSNGATLPRGSLVTDVVGGTFRESVNTVVTSIQFDFKNQQTITQTSQAGLGVFLGLFGAASSR